jgi:bacterioferritin
MFSRLAGKASSLPDELGHTQLLADKIVALGGTPTTVPATVKPANDAKEMLRNALEDEIETIDRYVQRRKQAEDLGHHGLAIDLDDLIQDESGHRDEIRMILRRWDSGQGGGGRARPRNDYFLNMK